MIANLGESESLSENYSLGEIQSLRESLIENLGESDSLGESKSVRVRVSI